MEERQKRVAGVFLYERRCQKTEKPLFSSYPLTSDWIIWEKEEFDREFNS